LREERIEDAKPEWWVPIMRANLEGNFHLVQQVAPALRRSEHGRLVLISTDLAERGYAFGWPYGAAKAGLHGLAASAQHDRRGPGRSRVRSSG
jgi:NAD(P)-dependent dehydrogenase (short-subunit alcohol dehydrogenase family)